MHRSIVAMLLLFPLAAQQTWIVDWQGGPGVDFVDLPQAVTAASAGDTIFVIARPPYAQSVYTAPTIDKALRIVGVDGGATSSGTGTGRAGCGGRITITGIPAGQQMLLCNMTVAYTGPTTTGLVISNCQGDVVLEDVLVGGSTWPNYLLKVESCANVTLRGCSIECNGGPLEVYDSNLLLTTTRIEYFDFPWLPPPINPPGLVLFQSDVTIVGSNDYGHDNSNSSGAPNWAPGALLFDSRLRVGPGSWLLGGYYAAGNSYYLAYQAPNQDTSVVEIDDRAQYVGSLGPANHPQPTSATIDATYHSWVVANHPYGVIVAGPPSGFALLMFGDMTSPTPTPFGMLSIDPLTAVPGALFALSAGNGSYQTTFFCPSGVPSGQAFVLQSLTLSPAGQLGLTVPSPLTVAWELGLTP